MLNLAGRGAIIAGTRRIGSVIAERLAAEGVNVAIVYRGSRDEAQTLLDSIRPNAPGSCILQADLTSEPEVERTVAEAKKQLRDLSFCINLASDYPRVPFEKLDAAAWDNGIIPAKANYLLSVHAARAMMSNPGPTRGHLVYFADWAAGETPYHDFLPYLTAKAAILFMTRAFALELAPSGILVNAISPGPTRRDVDVTEAEWRQALEWSPLHRESAEDEMAEMVVALLRMETITGEEIRVDAGRHIAGAGP